MDCETDLADVNNFAFSQEELRWGEDYHQYIPQGFFRSDKT